MYLSSLRVNIAPGSVRSASAAVRFFISTLTQFLIVNKRIWKIIFRSMAVENDYFSLLRRSVMLTFTSSIQLGEGDGFPEESELDIEIQI